MKKVLGFLFVLALAGTAFFFGWAQLPVPPGSYGVLRSKTHGVDGAPIRPGEFRWVWYKLIPTNAQTLVFALNPVSTPVSISGSLPSAATYAATAGISADFSYRIEASLSFTLKPDALPTLVVGKGVTDQAGLESYEKGLSREIGSFALAHLEAHAAEGDFPGGGQQGAAILEAELLQAFPDIENLSFAVHSAKLPDFALYAMVRSLYDEYLARQKELLRAEIAARAERNVDSLFRFDELEKYGELLTKYPVLLQYLALP
jgi:hypothetical protein